MVSNIVGLRRGLGGVIWHAYSNIDLHVRSFFNEHGHVKSIEHCRISFACNMCMSVDPFRSGNLVFLLYFLLFRCRFLLRIMDIVRIFVPSFFLFYARKFCVYNLSTPCSTLCFNTYGPLKKNNLFFFLSTSRI